MEKVETAEELLAKQHRKEKKDLQGKRHVTFICRIIYLLDRFPQRGFNKR